MPLTIRPTPYVPRLPAPTVEAINEARHAAKYLDHLADVAPTDQTHVVARAHAMAVWNAIDRLEELATLIEDLRAVSSSAIGDRGRVS
jgi:hypothetical protein